jgi:HSP20 family protein
MAELTIWKAEEMNRLRRDLGRMIARVWDDFCMPHTPPLSGGIDSIELFDREGSLLLRAHVPGIDPANLTVRVSEDRLTLQGASRTGGAGRARRVESRFEAFTRRLRLPYRIVPGEASATFREGILEVVLPKRKAEPPREIEIRVA